MKIRQTLWEQTFPAKRCFRHQVSDPNLDKLPIQIYDIMILHAPQWSDVSPQFTHGFPRQLISDLRSLISGHHGMVPGNLTVAATISNQAICSFSIGDVASFISCKMVKRLGLTCSELVLAHTTAAKYAGRKQKPSCPLSMMIPFGVDFRRLTSLTVAQVHNLWGTISTHWDQILEQADTNSESDSRLSDSSSDMEVPSSYGFKFNWEGKYPLKKAGLFTFSQNL